MTVVHRWMTRAVGAEDADDLTQDVFLRAYRGLGRFRGQAPPRAWLAAIADNAIKNRYRSRSRFRRIFASEASPDALEGRASGGRSPEESARAGEARGTVQDALSRLPIEFRLPIVLRDLEEWSYEEIATSLALPIGTVKSRIARVGAASNDPSPPWSGGKEIDERKRQPPAPGAIGRVPVAPSRWRPGRRGARALRGASNPLRGVPAGGARVRGRDLAVPVIPLDAPPGRPRRPDPAEGAVDESAAGPVFGAVSARPGGRGAARDGLLALLVSTPIAVHRVPPPAAPAPSLRPKPGARPGTCSRRRRSRTSKPSRAFAPTEPARGALEGAAPAVAGNTRRRRWRRSRKPREVELRDQLAKAGSSPRTIPSRRTRARTSCARRPPRNLRASRRAVSRNLPLRGAGSPAAPAFTPSTVRAAPLCFRKVRWSFRRRSAAASTSCCSTRRASSVRSVRLPRPRRFPGCTSAPAAVRDDSSFASSESAVGISERPLYF